MPGVDHPERIFPDLPAEVREVLLSMPEAEFATVSSAGMPVNNPVFHYFGAGGRTSRLSTR